MTIETPQDLAGLQRIGRVVGETLHYLRSKVRPGMTTAELDKLAHHFLAQRGARSAPQLDVGFPGAICISINEEAAHGVPGKRRIRPGDLVKLDVSAEMDGFYADAAITVAVPPVSQAHRQLCISAENALAAAIQASQNGAPLYEIGRATEKSVLQSGYQVVRTLHGHGVGRSLHEEPSGVPAFYHPRYRGRLHEGLVLALEPHVTTGNGSLRERNDGWTLATEDGGYVAAFEHTVVVQGKGSLIVTAF
jgi:methionyl aminopeptidase